MSIIRFIRFIILQSILVIFWFIVLEGIGQTYFYLKHGFSFSDSLLYVKDDKLDYKLNPNYKGKDIINNGFRGEPFSKEKPKDTYRIVAMGGSTTWGGTSFQYSWPFQLNKLLNENVEGSRKYEVINAGHCGYGTSQLLIRLEEEILGLKPDMIIIYEGWNGLGSVEDSVYSWIPDNIAKRNCSIMERTGAFLTNNSLIYAKLRAKFPRFLDRFDLSYEDKKKLKEYYAEMAKKNGLNIRKMIKIIHNNGITPVIIKYPKIYSDNLSADDLELLKEKIYQIYKNHEYLNWQHKTMMNEIERAAREEGALLIDAAGYFDNLPYSEKLGFFLDEAHLVDEGFVPEAKVIFNALMKHFSELPAT